MNDSQREAKANDLLRRIHQAGWSVSGIAGPALVLLPDGQVLRVPGPHVCITPGDALPPDAVAEISAAGADLVLAVHGLPLFADLSQPAPSAN